ncbi:hypothetical protein [Actinomadura sp. HBU206391]|uniref:hypothetical protein n=1 Tax=Actinomadura sp. HBU206391 TaxID=2731692 RepID=UPI00164F555B|nr:hypothetical protein [Actinomadura sp. HBU206391]MBC6457405.1 hypothetical protein [Actinomadura sp. HBU206391]
MAAGRKTQRLRQDADRRSAPPDDSPSPDGARRIRSHGEPDLRINLRRRANYARAAPSIPDEILLGKERSQKAGGFAALDTLLRELTSVGAAVEAVTGFRAISVPITSADQFWALFIADLVLLQSKDGPRKWLIRETSKGLRSRDPERVDRLRLVWKQIFDVLLQADGLGSGEDLARLVMEFAGHRASHLFEVMDLLFAVAQGNPPMLDRLTRVLESYERSLPVLAPPELRVRIKQLLGRTTGLIGPRSPFPPELIRVPVASLCSYEFEVMRFPLTVGDVAFLLGTSHPAYRKTHDPYVFDIAGRGLDHFVSRFLPDLLARCVDVDPDVHMSWAVPTANEWPALAGCEENDYPWGRDAPSPERANLRYGGTPGRIRPVGVHPAGESPLGVADCCGNVHEIVEWRPRGSAPEDYRLAGGCFQTWHDETSCRRFRRFIPKESEDRQNVGLRLIRYHSGDADLRARDLDDYTEGRHTGRRPLGAGRRG